MSEFFFISYSKVDSEDFATTLANELTADRPPIRVWLDKREIRAGSDWDEQIVEALRTCKGVLFVLSTDSVHPDSICKEEWVRALKYKKPVIPLLYQRGVELPFRLGSRQCIDFGAGFDVAVAQLRKHVAWMDSPQGQLQALKHRLTDAQRELPRADAEQRQRIREDISELERQIAQQQKVVENPAAAQQRVQQSINVGLEGERQPEKPVRAFAPGKFINPPPLIAPTWFQDRHVETRQLGDFLRDESLRLMTVVGRGGVGKSAMVCRLLRSLEGGQLPDEGGALPVDGIVYLSDARSMHRVNVPDLCDGLVKLLAADAAKRFDVVYKNPHSSTLAIMQALVDSFPSGRTVVLLDNFEDALDIETGRVKDAELDEALQAFLQLPPHGLKLIITTRVAPSDLAMVEPGRQRRLDLDAGLEKPYAEDVLRAMDAGGKVGLRDAPDAILDEARVRTLGFPRALEHLFGILSADRDSSLQGILNDTRRFLPEKVVTVLVGEAYSRLDQTAQQVMQALATFRYPVPAAAVDYLLQPHVPGIDSGPALSRLVNMRFVHRDAGRYYLHQVDCDYALKRLADARPVDGDSGGATLTRPALRSRAAEWFKLSRKPRDSWKTLADLAAQLSEFELRCEGEDYDTAAVVLLEFDFACLHLWGHYRLMAELHERLRDKLTDPELAIISAGNLGTAYQRAGRLEASKDCYEQALRLARDSKDRRNEGWLVGNLGGTLILLGQHTRAIDCLTQSLTISLDVGDRIGESARLGNLGIIYDELGEQTQAIEHHLRALSISREIKDRASEADDLDNLARAYINSGKLAEALRCCLDGLAIARDIGGRRLEAAIRCTLARSHLLQGDSRDAVREAEQAIELADEIGESRSQVLARLVLALANLYQGDLERAGAAAEAARRYNDRLDNPTMSAVLGIIALLQNDPPRAREAFQVALREATALLAMTPRLCDVLDTKALALAGLALAGEPQQLALAKAAYAAARAVSAHAGRVTLSLQRFDALAQADPNGILAELRPIAAEIRAE